ncbi:Protein FAM204A [Trichoplax sp. H2]|nr:Protein FAM204A [Trichoplax sp. H2]|eukprot:RDD41954.1 Protein FAM204A [Trichoplax sp. H2]
MYSSVPPPTHSNNCKSDNPSVEEVTNRTDRDLLKNVPERIQLKFAQLQQRRKDWKNDKGDQRRTDKLKKKITRDVVNQLQNNDVDVNTLKDVGVTIPAAICNRNKKTVQSNESHQPIKNDAIKWQQIKERLKAENPYIEENVDRQYKAKTKIETDIDEAIEAGDYDRAENLSSQISNLQFATEITNAIRRLKYETSLQNIPTEKKRKRRNLYWTFESKQRWETKGNM